MKTSLTVLPSWTCNLLHQGVNHPSPPHLALLSHPPVERGQRRRGSLRLTRPISALPNRTRTCSSLVGPNDPIRCSYSFAWGTPLTFAAFPLLSPTSHKQSKIFPIQSSGLIALRACAYFAVQQIIASNISYEWSTHKLAFGKPSIFHLWPFSVEPQI